MQQLMMVDHRLVPIHEVRVEFLRWHVSRGTKKAHIAQVELKRRGITLEKEPIGISNHAVDRASQRCLSLWKETRNRNEGLASWLKRMAYRATCEGTKRSCERNVYSFLGFRFYFQQTDIKMVLTTVMPDI